MRVQMSWFERNECRFGNQFFAYYFLKIIESELKCEIATPNWLGCVLFNLTSSMQLMPAVATVDLESQISRDKGPEAEIRTIAENYLDRAMNAIEVMGSFQYHTSNYLKYRSLFFEVFKLNQSLAQQLDRALEVMGFPVQQIVCIHLRRGDYLKFDKDHPLFWGRSFEAALKSISDLLMTSYKNATIYLCSDDIEYCKREFEARNISYLTHANLFSELDDTKQLITDFMMMARSNVLMISNSSLSFAASMLNQNARIFLRPCPKEDRYIPFDPWNSHVLLPQYPFHFS